MIALATPHAYEHDGLIFGLGYLLVTALHAGMFVRGVTADELRAILRIAPFNLLGALLVVAGGALGGDAQTILWAAVAVLLWLTPRFTSVEGLVIGVAHFVERHGLVVIIALGESIVVARGGNRRSGARRRDRGLRAARARAQRRAVVGLLQRRDRRRGERSTARRPSAAHSSRCRRSGTGTTGCCSP